jgi:hypothetical protein
MDAKRLREEDPTLSQKRRRLIELLDFFERLPIELTGIILVFVGAISAWQSRLVCKRWDDLVKTRYTNAIEHILHDRFERLCWSRREAYGTRETLCLRLFVDSQALEEWIMDIYRYHPAYTETIRSELYVYVTSPPRCYGSRDHWNMCGGQTEEDSVRLFMTRTEKQPLVVRAMLLAVMRAEVARMQMTPKEARMARLCTLLNVPRSRIRGLPK